MLCLDRRLADELAAHATDGRPEEVCGVLGGEYGDSSSRVECVHRTENVAEDARTAYEIDLAELVAEIDAIEAADRDVVGFYHSHPRGPLEPSPTDVADATWVGYSYVVLRPGDEDPTIGSWRWRGEAFEEERVRIDQNAAANPT